MKKTVILYGGRNTGLCILSFLVAKGFEVKVMSSDMDILWMAQALKLKVVTLDTMGEFDLFICCHGIKIIEEKYLVPGRMINIHPVLYKYPGHNPIKKYIENGDTEASVEVQYLIMEVDKGKVICRHTFVTPKVNTHAEFYNLALPFYFKVLNMALNILNV